MDAADDAHHLLALAEIQPRGGLVQHQHGRLQHRHGGQRQKLARAAVQKKRVVVGREAELPDDRVHARLGVRVRNPERLEAE